jgi:hypothetical protein
LIVKDVPTEDSIVTSLNRAKRLIERNFRTIAISMVALGGLIASQSPAWASPQLAGFSTGICTVGAATGTSGNVLSTSGGCTEQSDGQDPTSLLYGVKILDSGAGDPLAVLSGTSGLFGVDVHATGLANVLNFTGTIPVYWDFTPTASDGGNISYQLTYSLFGSAAQLISGDINVGGPPPITESGTIASGSVVSGVADFNLLGQNISSYTIDLQVTENASAGESGRTVSVNIPSSSVDLADTVSATPEPTSIVLFGTGLLALAGRRLRRSIN